MILDIVSYLGLREQGKLTAIKDVNDNEVPYMTLKKHDNIPTSIAFPLDEMPLKYAESSIAYMIWYAVHIGATEIETFVPRS